MIANERVVFKNLGDQEDKEISKVLKKFLSIFIKVPGSDVNIKSLNDMYVGFCDIIRKTGSVVSGGLILSAVRHFINDKSEKLYIYADLQGAIMINEFLKTTYIRSKAVNITPIKKFSTLRKNKIKAKIVYSRKDKTEPKNTINIMVVGSESTPYNVVKNKDFTFCQILFDGDHVQATYPDHIKSKKGILGEEYLPLLKDKRTEIPTRISKYNKRGFDIAYLDPTGIRVSVGKNNYGDTPHTFIIYDEDESDEDPVVDETSVEDDSYGDETTTDESLIHIWQSNILTSLENVLTLKSYGISDVYLKWLYLEKNTIEDFFMIIVKLATEGKCLLPLWIQDTYIKEEDIIKAIAIDLLGLDMYIEYEEDAANVAYVIKLMGFENKEEIERLTKEIYEKMDAYKKRPDITKEKELIRQYNQYECIFNDQIKKLEFEAAFDRKKTRNIQWLNIVKPSKLRTVEFNEKKLVEESSGCNYLAEGGVYNINSYLKGEKVDGYKYIKDTEKLKLDDSLELPAVSEREALKRIVFFLAKSKDRFDDLKPFCYNIDMLSSDVARQIFSECNIKEDGTGTMEKIQEKFLENPIITIDLEAPIFVPLSELLSAIYTTKKQVFVLNPTDKVFKYTCSLLATYGVGYEGNAHCNAGSEKQIHTLMVCDGNKENLCWPVNNSIETIEIEPDKFFLLQKYHLLSRDANKYIYKQSNRVNTIEKPMEREDLLHLIAVRLSMETGISLDEAMERLEPVDQVFDPHDVVGMLDMQFGDYRDDYDEQ